MNYIEDQIIKTETKKSEENIRKNEFLFFCGCGEVIALADTEENNIRLEFDVSQHDKSGMKFKCGKCEQEFALDFRKAKNCT